MSERSDAELANWRVDLSNQHPRVAGPLLESELRRQQAAAVWKPRSARLSGLNQLLIHLDCVAAAFGQNRREQALSNLVMRTARDFEAAVEAGFSGYVSVAADAMRDVLEATDLVLMFSTDIELVDAWLDTPLADHWKRFSPARVRRHLHRNGVKYQENSRATRDYQGHSTALHVNPWPMFIGEKGIYPIGAPLFNDIHFWEIFLHARELVYALDRLRDMGTFHWPEVSRAEDLDEGAEAYAVTYEMQTLMFTAIDTYSPTSWRDLHVAIEAVVRDYAARNVERQNKSIWRPQRN